MVASFQDRFRRAYRVLEEAEGGERISQAEIGRRMAQRLGMGRSPAAVSEWWTGKSIPDTITMAALADVLGASPGWLAFGEGEMERGDGMEWGGPAPEPAPDLKPKTRAAIAEGVKKVAAREAASPRAED